LLSAAAVGVEVEVVEVVEAELVEEFQSERRP